jgi:hypothetical protein
MSINDNITHLKLPKSRASQGNSGARGTFLILGTYFIPKMVASGGKMHGSQKSLPDISKRRFKTNFLKQ